MLGITAAFLLGNPFPAISGRPTKYFLQASVVLLGFGMDLMSVYRAGRDGIGLTVATIVDVCCRILLGRLFRLIQV